MDSLRSCGYSQYNAGATGSAFNLNTAPTSGKKLSDSIPSDGSNQQPRGVLLQAEGANIRYTVSGNVTPTSSVGFLLYNGSDPFLYTGDLAKLQFIQAAAGAILNVGYFY